MKYILKCGKDEYYLARGQGTTDDIAEAFHYDKAKADELADGYWLKARLELELSQSQDIRAAQHNSIMSLRRQVDVLKEAQARLTKEFGVADSCAYADIADLRRQNADLQAANNKLLQRARDAEALIGQPYSFTQSLNFLAADVHRENEKWWTDPATGKRIERNKGEMIALMHSELSEMLEGVRKDKMDDHLPLKNEVVELADLFIRALDYSGAYKFDLGGAIEAKRAYNRTRPDHTHEARLAKGGKAF